MAVTAGHFNSEIENWRNVLKAINYWFNTFSGKYQWQKNKINNQDYGWLMAGQPGSQCMSCIMLDVDIRTKSKQIDKKIYQLMLWNYWIETLPHSLLTEELRKKVNLLRVFRRKKFCLLGEKKNGLCDKYQLWGNISEV